MDIISDPVPPRSVMKIKGGDARSGAWPLWDRCLLPLRGFLDAGGARLPCVTSYGTKHLITIRAVRFHAV